MLQQPGCTIRRQLFTSVGMLHLLPITRCAPLSAYAYPCMPIFEEDSASPPHLLCLQLCDLYENDCIFDKFDCCMSGNGMRLATGSYSNTFRVMGRQPNAMPDTILEASRDPLRRRLAGPKVPSPALSPPVCSLGLCRPKSSWQVSPSGAPGFRPAGSGWAV